MLIQDAFNSNAFAEVELTAAINKQPFVPRKLGSMGLFEEKGVSVLTIAVEESDGTLSLIPNTARGAPSNQNLHSKRKLRPLNIPHFPLDETIMAEEIQGIRAFGSSELQVVERVRDDRLREMRAKHDATLEYGRIGAVKGIIYDSNGSTVIYNLFTEFGETQDSVDFVLGTATTDIKGKCVSVSRLVETELGADMYDHIHVFCGDEWFDKFVRHTEVKAAYERWAANGSAGGQGQFLREDNRRGFPFAGMIFENYRGSVGGVDFVADAEAHFFPVGVPGLFITRFGPADFMETVNTLGLPMYAKAEMKRFDRGIDIHTQSNPISICTRPKVLVKGTTSN